MKIYSKFLNLKDVNNSLKSKTNHRNSLNRLQFYDLWKKRFWSIIKKKVWKTFKRLHISQEDDFTTGFLLDYLCFKKHDKMKVTDFGNQQELDTDPKAIQQLNFCENLNLVGNTKMFFTFEKPNETVLDFSKRTVRVLKVYFALI